MSLTDNPDGTYFARFLNASRLSLNWYNYTAALGASGPQICDIYTGSTVATRCYDNSNCKGANYGSNNCYPSHIWAQQYASTAAYGTYLSNNWWSWSANGWDKAYAFSVRCVTAIEY